MTVTAGTPTTPNSPTHTATPATSRCAKPPGSPDTEGTREVRAALAVNLPAGPAAPAICRRAVQCLLESAGRTDLTDDASTVASELVANAVEHAASPIQLRLRLRGPSLRIAVRDGCTSRWPRISGDLDAWDAERGRGLVMISVLTHGWSARLISGGKEVAALL